jgi:hypothetical protein
VTNRVFDDPEYYFKDNVSNYNSCDPLKIAKGLFTDNSFLCCQAPEIMDAARGEEVGNNPGGPETYHKPGKPANELL